MFGWFKKRPPAMPAANSEARDWANMRGELGSKTVFVRIRTSLRARSAQVSYEHEITVEIAFHELQENGLPSSHEELTAVDELEDWLKDRLESASRSVLGLVITGDGVRVCYFYSADPRTAIRVWEEELQPNVHSHQLTFRVRPDPEWQMYRSFLGEPTASADGGRDPGS
jgi:hypothetical protein